jgi:hypothetical protein
MPLLEAEAGIPRTGFTQQLQEETLIVLLAHSLLLPEENGELLGILQATMFSLLVMNQSLQLQDALNPPSYS